MRLAIEVAIAVGPMSAKGIERGAVFTARRHRALLAPLADDRHGADNPRMQPI